MGLGSVPRTHGNSQQARVYFEEVQVVAEEHALPQFRCQALNGLGVLAVTNGDFMEAQALYEMMEVSQPGDRRYRFRSQRTQ